MSMRKKDSNFGRPSTAERLHSFINITSTVTMKVSSLLYATAIDVF